MSTIDVSGYTPLKNGAVFVGSSKAIFILKSGSGGMLLEVDMSVWWSSQKDNVRTLRDANNNIDMHFLTTDMNKQFIFIAHRSTQSDTTIPTSNLPALTIELVRVLNFDTAQ